MLEKNARTFRNVSLVLSLIVFALGILEVIMYSFDMSLHTGIIARTGLQPESFLGGATFLALLAIAFGTIHVKN
jgi:hypothetical protein